MANFDAKDISTHAWARNSYGPVLDGSMNI